MHEPDENEVPASMEPQHLQIDPELPRLDLAREKSDSFHKLRPSNSNGDPSPKSKEENKLDGCDVTSKTFKKRQKVKNLREERSVLVNEGAIVDNVMDEPKFCRMIPLARGCLCGCVSLKCAMTILTLIDITFGLASVGIIYIMVTSAVPVTALVFRVLLYMLAGIFATYSLI